MPNYSFTCVKCNRYSELHLSISDRNNKQKCKICGGKMVRAIDAPVLTGMNNLGQSR